METFCKASYSVCIKNDIFRPVSPKPTPSFLAANLEHLSSLKLYNLLHRFNPLIFPEADSVTKVFGRLPKDATLLIILYSMGNNNN